MGCLSSHRFGSTKWYLVASTLSNLIFKVNFRYLVKTYWGFMIHFTVQAITSGSVACSMNGANALNNLISVIIETD